MSKIILKSRMFNTTILIVCIASLSNAGAATKIPDHDGILQNQLLSVSNTNISVLQEHNGEMYLVQQSDSGESQQIALDWKPTHADKLSQGVVLGKVLQNNPGLDISEAKMRVYLADGSSWEPKEYPVTYEIAPNGQSLVVLGKIADQFSASLYTASGQLLGRIPAPVLEERLHPSRIYKPSINGKQLLVAPIPEQVSADSISIYEGSQLTEHRELSIEGKWISDAIAIDSDATILLSEGRVFGFNQYGVAWVGYPHPFSGEFTSIEVSPDGQYVLAVSEATGAFHVYASKTGGQIVSRDFKGIENGNEKKLFRFLDKEYPLRKNPKKRYYYPQFDVTFDAASRLLLKVPHEKEVTYYAVTLADSSEKVQMLTIPASQPVYFSGDKAYIYDNNKLQTLAVLKQKDTDSAPELKRN